jgi:hypothetical protein
MKPSIALSNPHEKCVTFYWDETPEYYLGYRFVEGEPMISDQPVVGYESQPVPQRIDPPEITAQVVQHPPGSAWRKEWLSAWSEQDHSLPIQLSFRLSGEDNAHVLCIDNERQQQREFYFQPFSQGVRIWARLTAHQAIKGSYCLQQCLRFTGMYNAEWRKLIAHMPFLSELDMQAMGHANGTLTYARRDRQWVSFPVQHVIYPAKTGFENRPEPQGEYVDHGLIVRETPDRVLAPDWYWERVAPDAAWVQMTCGMYWERTAYLSNRHPADCVHSWIDFGPLAEGQTRTIQGVVYFIEGSKDDLLELWERDFKDKLV